MEIGSKNILKISGRKAELYLPTNIRHCAVGYVGIIAPVGTLEIPLVSVGPLLPLKIGTTPSILKTVLGCLPCHDELATSHSTLSQSAVSCSRVRVGAEPKIVL